MITRLTNPPLDGLLSEPEDKIIGLFSAH